MKTWIIEVMMRGEVPSKYVKLKISMVFCVLDFVLEASYVRYVLDINLGFCGGWERRLETAGSR